MAIKRFYRFSYFTPVQKDRDLLVHQLRDADAALQISALLYNLGYRYGGVLFNHPTDTDRAVLVDHSFLRPRDILLLATRPPLDDELDRTRSRLQRSHTTLEEKVFACLEQYFQHCSRAEVVLTKSLASRLPKQVAEKREVVFREYGGAFCERYSGRTRRRHLLTTITYMTFTPEAWPKGPGLLTVFGMGGPETLIWAHVLRTRFPHLVCSRSFVMAEMTEQVIPPGQLDLSFSDQWEVKILAEIPLHAVRGKPRARL